MHAVTSSIFLPSYVRSLQPENAARLLRDKLAVDLGHFVSRGRPELNLDQLLSYQPRKPELVRSSPSPRRLRVSCVRVACACLTLGVMMLERP